MFSTGDLSVDIVMVTIKKQERENPRSVWFNRNTLVLIVTSHGESPKLRPSRLQGYDPMLGGTKLGEGVYWENSNRSCAEQSWCWWLASHLENWDRSCLTSGCHHYFGHLVFDRREQIWACGNKRRWCSHQHLMSHFWRCLEHFLISKL